MAFIGIPGNYQFVVNRISSPKIALDRTSGSAPAGVRGGFPETVVQFRVFSALWAIASLFHMAHSSIFDSELDLALLTLSALYAIFRPSVKALLLLALLQVFDACFRMPFTTNHWLFTAFVNLTILQSLLFLVIKQRSFRVNEGAWLETFAPAVRVELIILYFFAVFHKLNSGFFSPASSCATDLLQAQQISTIFPLSAGWFAFNAYFTIFIETLIPVGLCFRRTRNLAIVAGIVFHGILSYSTYNAFYDFSSMVMAVYFLFASPDFASSQAETWYSVRTRVSRVFQRYDGRRLMLVMACTTIALAVIYVLSKKLDSFKAVHLYFFWTLYSFGFALLFLRFMLKPVADGRSMGTSGKLPHWSFGILPAIVLLNGMCPYLGLKTENSYAMFSNLRTEGGTTNHYLVPAGWQVFDYQKDVVQILSSTDPGLQKLASGKKAMVLFEFRNYVHRQKPARVDYLLNGKLSTFRYGAVPMDAALEKDPYVLTKLMRFRVFRVEEPQPCSH